MLSFDLEALMNQCLDSQATDDYDWVSNFDAAVDLVDEFAELAVAYLELKGRMDGLGK